MSEKTAKILEEMNGVFARVLERPGIAVSETTTAADVEGWDSLTHNELIAAIESHFGTRFTLREQARFENVGDICRVIQAKLGS